MQPTASDFWGIVFPAYLGAAGAIISGAVAAWALMREIRTRRGLREVASGQNAEQSSRSTESFIAAKSATDAFLLSVTGEREQSSPVSWVLVDYGLYHKALRNVSSTPARITRIKQLNGEMNLYYRFLPTTIDPGAELRVERTPGGPAVIATEFAWTEPGTEGERSVVFYL